MARIRQQLDGSHLSDIRVEIGHKFALHGPHVIVPGMRVAITAGSRGIANLATIIQAVVDQVRALGAEPFVVAAMGSHGGATAEGQRAVLAGYGVTEPNVGCPIVSSMQTACLGQTGDGFSVYIDRAALESDGIILLNRVKPHSSLTGELGSGLMKMAAIGLGKRDGADSIHRRGITHHLLPAARMVLECAPVKLGVAIVENALDQTWKVEVVPPDQMEATDKRLLAEARALLPTIPFEPIDLLIVDRIGKNFSGTGMDPNVIGMHRRLGGPVQREIHRIVALDLSDESHGNACGVGMADIVTERLRDKIDWAVTYMNVLTADFLAGAKLPLVCKTAREAVEVGMKPFDPGHVRAVRISDTAHLEQMWVSEALVRDLDRYPGCTQSEELEEFAFELS